MTKWMSRAIGSCSWWAKTPHEPQRRPENAENQPDFSKPCGSSLPSPGVGLSGIPVLSLKRLLFDETEGKVRYQHSRHGSQEESMDYLEFIARVTSHIPDKGQVMIRYYGLYSNAHRGKDA